MSFAELLPHLQDLPRAEKIRLVQYLANELAREEGIPLSENSSPHQIWTPFDAFEAASVLLNALQEDEIGS